MLRFALRAVGTALPLRGVNTAMSWTRYYSPGQIAYFAPEGTGWADTQGGLSTHRNIIMTGGLVGTASSGGGILASDCRALLLTDFGITDSGTLQGIEVVTEIDRVGRVIDQTLQLALAGQLIGRNLASTSTDSRQSYGGSLSQWGITTVDWQSTQFGLVIDLSPNLEIPSNERPIIREVFVRLDLI